MTDEQVEYAPGIRKGSRWVRLGDVHCTTRLEAELLVSTYNRGHYKAVHGQAVELIARPLGPWAKVTEVTDG